MYLRFLPIGHVKNLFTTLNLLFFLRITGFFARCDSFPFIMPSSIQQSIWDAKARPDLKFKNEYISLPWKFPHIWSINPRTNTRTVEYIGTSTWFKVHNNICGWHHPSVLCIITLNILEYQFKIFKQTILKSIPAQYFWSTRECSVCEWLHS